MVRGVSGVPAGIFQNVSLDNGRRNAVGVAGADERADDLVFPGDRAELGKGFEPPYEPLNDCSLYKPHTKRRHHLSAEYWKKIDPSRVKLPVCEDAHRKSGVAVHHHVLMGSKKDMDDIAAAVKKTVKHIDELKAEGPQASRKRYRALAI